MSLISLRCPSCGAEVVFSGEKTGHCPYCDSQLHFDDLVDKDELERLRSENEEYERNEATEEIYRRSLKLWKKIAAGIMSVIALLNIVAFPVLLMKNRYAGTGLLLAAFGIFLFAPLVLGLTYPCFSDKKASTSGRAAKRAVRVLLVYGAAVAVGVVSMLVGAFVTIGLGYESDSKDSSSTASVRYSDDCDIFVREWVESMCSDDDEDIEHYFSCICPTEVWERDKDSEDTYILVERHRAILKQATDSYKLKVTDVTRLNELTDDELSGAEEYFRERYDYDVTAMQGYEYSFTVNAEVKKGADIGYDNSEGDNESFLCVVKLKGDGWKIINDDASLLRSYSNE